MACCQGDTGQPGSVSFADANETSQLLKAHAKPSLETQTEQAVLPREQLLHPPGSRGEGDVQQFSYFSRLLVMYLLSAPVYSLKRKKRLLLVSLCPKKTPPYWHLSPPRLLSCFIDSLCWIGLFCEGDGKQRALLNNSPQPDKALHPGDNKKADSFVWLEVNSWEQMMLAGWFTWPQPQRWHGFVVIGTNRWGEGQWGEVKCRSTGSGLSQEENKIESRLNNYKNNLLKNKVLENTWMIMMF